MASKASPPHSPTPGVQRAALDQIDHAKRLRYDAETVLALQLYEWSDNAWMPVADALAEYGFAVMRAWIATGKIYPEMKRVNRSLRPCPQGWQDEETVVSLAGETTALAIREFKKILQRGAWKPDKGASLATYFIGQCKLQYANVYRTWLRREETRRSRPVLYDTERVRSADPATVTIEQERMEAVLAQMSPLSARVFRLKYVEGYTYVQIAQEVPGLKNAKAVENLITREKARWKSQRKVS
ncbi:RNA polymerase sigma factor [Dermacoccus abyssi]